jgi:hypothetical protein
MHALYPNINEKKQPPFKAAVSTGWNKQPLFASFTEIMSAVKVLLSVVAVSTAVGIGGVAGAGLRTRDREPILFSTPKVAHPPLTCKVSSACRECTKFINGVKKTSGAAFSNEALRNKLTVIRHLYNNEVRDCDIQEFCGTKAKGAHANIGGFDIAPIIGALGELACGSAVDLGMNLINNEHGKITGKAVCKLVTVC